MILSSAGLPHLTYCTNIHRGESWAEVRRNVERHVLAVKARVAPTRRFGVGLRLSAAAARTLSEPAELEAFRAFLDAHGLYVFTINGFPYGPFHGEPVKERVYLPDWLDDERRAYHDLLARVLARLLPDDPAVGGSISTVPGAFKRRGRAAGAMRRIAEQMIDHAAVLHRIHEESGRIIALAVEPEPCCVLETTAEATAFFRNHLFDTPSLDRFCALTGLGRTTGEAALRRHLGICLDTCHAAVAFEEPADTVHALRRAGISIAKIQLSTGLRVSKFDDGTLGALRAFAEDTYLHQVIERRSGVLTRYVDLPDALGAATRTLANAECEWRIHFHVPIFMRHLGPFENTQGFLEQILELQAAQPVSTHLEVETYTWEVLPEEHRKSDVVAAVAQELRWVCERLG